MHFWPFMLTIPQQTIQKIKINMKSTLINNDNNNKLR